MHQQLLARLASSGVLERSAGTLRVNPRFLGHLDGTAARLGNHATRLGATSLLATALASWDDYVGPARPAAAFLQQFLTERDQWGSLRTHVMLDAYVAA
jgi:hypothetical protein